MLTSKSLASNLLKLVSSKQTSMTKAFTQKIVYNNSTLLNEEPSGDVYTWEGGEKPKKLDMPEKIKRISIGQGHTSIVSESGYLQY